MWERRHWPCQCIICYSRFFLFTKTFCSQRWRRFSFFIATFLLVVAMHSTVYRNMGVNLASTGIVLGRPLIGVAVSWFIIMDACGYSCKLNNISTTTIRFMTFFSPGLVSRIFSSKVFVRINKLTYAIYLLNPIIISVVFGKFENGGTVDPTLYFIIMIGITIITYMFAIVFTLLFEIPFYKLSNEILKGAQPVLKKIN